MFFPPPAFADDGPEINVAIGSYGRVEAATDPSGSAADPITLTAHPGRLLADPYLELDVGWSLETQDGAKFFALVTPALSGPLFHTTGDFSSALALRNLYAQAQDFGLRGLGVWAGSRMYRGDDVYLLDFWPLDNLNTVGGGANYRTAGLNVAAHVGLNRLSSDEWQYQSLDETTPGSVGAASVTTLDRQRTIGSLKASYAAEIGPLTLRPKLYGELHSLPAGVREVQMGIAEALPRETAWLGGGQVSIYGYAKDSYVHLTYRHATGIAALGELTVPTSGFALDGSVNNAVENLGAVAVNQEFGVVGVAGGAYFRAWRDADANTVDADDGWEWVVALRPAVYPTRYVSIAAEVAHEAIHPAGLDPRTTALERPSITRFSLLPAVQLGKGTFARPKVHLRYTVALISQDALDRLDSQDVRRARGPVQHTLGLGAEWWIASQGYR